MNLSTDTLMLLKRDIEMEIKRRDPVIHQAAPEISSEALLRAIPEQAPVPQPTINDYRGTVNIAEPVAKHVQNIPSMRIPVPNASSGPSASNTGSTPPEVDSAGVAYNPAIHSSSKNFNKDGTWRTRRNLPKDAPAAAPSTVPSPAIQQVAPVLAFPQPTAVAAMAPVAAPSPASFTLNVPQHSAPAPTTRIFTIGGDHEYNQEFFFNNLVPILTQLITENKITQQYIDALKAHFQVKEIWNVLASSASMDQMFNSFCEHGLIKRVE